MATLGMYTLEDSGEEDRKEGREEGGARPRAAGFATYLYFPLYLIPINK